MLVLDWTRKVKQVQTKAYEGGTEAEDRDGEDLVCVPQVSGQVVGTGSPTSCTCTHCHLLFRKHSGGTPASGSPVIKNDDEENTVFSSSLRRVDHLGSQRVLQSQEKVTF